MRLQSSFAIVVLAAIFFAACTSQKIDQDLPTSTGETGAILNLALAEPLSDFSTLSFQAADREYLSQIYEPLVRFDATFNISSSLAVSWGRLDDLTWNFRLRDGVLFQDGMTLTAEDVRASIEAARLNPLSELSSLLSTIDQVSVTSVDHLEIKTKAPDPLLLNRLAQVYISPRGKTPEVPIGTGPYHFESYQDGVLTLKRFDGYWGPAPRFETVQMIYTPNPEDRLSNFRSKKADVLVGVPAKSVETLKNEGFNVQNYPALELSSIFLNPIGPFANADLRKAFALALQTDYATPFADGFLIPTQQLAASGIFGYNPSFTGSKPELTEALELRQKTEGPVILHLDLPLGVEALGEALARDLSAIAIDVQIQTHEPKELEKRILSSQSEAYFLGWKYDLGDSADFLEAALHSRSSGKGTFNGLQWLDPQVDAFLDQAAQSLDVEKRRTLLQAAMAEAQSANVVFPLFESQALVALRSGLEWTPRLDGLVLASEILPVVVQ